MIYFLQTGGRRAWIRSAMAWVPPCVQSLTSLSRSLLVLLCALLAGYQCWTLLQLYLSQPVSMSLSFTKKQDLAVPAVTFLLATTVSWHLSLVH